MYKRQLRVVNRNKNMGHANRIDRKHVDFVLCDPKTMQPKLVVELDDSSHQRADRKKRDQEVDDAFSAAQLPILHVICKSQYQSENLKRQIQTALTPKSARVESLAVEPESIQAQATDATATTSPVCPKCNVPMVQRTASRGGNRGKRFWGCPSYPSCRKTFEID